MNILKTNENELRIGWKILRVVLIVIVLAVAFALVSSLLSLQLLGDYAIHLSIILGVLIALRLEHRSINTIGLQLREKSLWMDSLLGFVAGALAISLVALGMVFITREINPDQFGINMSLPGLAGILAYWLVVGIAEEMLFRGYILTLLREKLRLWPAILISAALFAVIHILNPDYYFYAFLYALLIGILFCGIVYKRGNLGGVIGFHFAWNLLQDGSFYNFPAQGGELMFTLILIVMGIMVLWVLPRGKPVRT